MFAVQFEKEIRNRMPGVAIEIAGGFITQEQARAIDERSRDGHALLFAAGKFRGKMFEPMREADALQQGAGILLLFIRAFAKGERGQQDVFEHGVLRQEMVLLKHKADGLIAKFCQRRFGQSEGIPVAECDCAGGRLIQRAEQVQERALAGAGRADDGKRLAGRNFKRQLAQNFDAARAALESFGDTRNVELCEIRIVQDQTRE